MSEPPRTPTTPESPAAALKEFASNCVVWQAEATMRAKAAKDRGDEASYHYEDGQTDAFEVCGRMARMRADSLT
jgi:hypothetical protein